MCGRTTECSTALEHLVELSRLTAASIVLIINKCEEPLLIGVLHIGGVGKSGGYRACPRGETRTPVPLGVLTAEKTPLRELVLTDVVSIRFLGAGDGRQDSNWVNAGSTHAGG